MAISCGTPLSQEQRYPTVKKMGVPIKNTNKKQTTGTDISAASPVLSALPFKGFSDYLAVAAGDYYVTITAAGNKSPVIGPLAVNLTNGQLLTAAALSDSVGGVDPALLILNDANN